MRATAALALGPILEQADTDGFEDPHDVPITQRTFLNIQDSLHKLHSDNSIPKEVRRRILEVTSPTAPFAYQARTKNGAINDL